MLVEKAAKEDKFDWERLTAEAAYAGKEKMRVQGVLNNLNKRYKLRIKIGDRFGQTQRTLFTPKQKLSVSRSHAASPAIRRLD